MTTTLVSTPTPEDTTQHHLVADHHLPQLPTILDPRVMKDHLQNRMFASAAEHAQFIVQRCDILQVRYKPTSSCMVTYRLDIEHAATQARGEQILCGRAFPAGTSLTQWEKAAARPLVQPRFGKALVHLPEIEMVLWSFPNDRKIRTLPAALDIAHSTPEFLSGWLARHRRSAWNVCETTSNIMHYVGEHTCTVRMSVDIVHSVHRTHDTLTLFGKTYYDDEGAHTDRVMRQLWDSDARRTGRLALAQPLWYDEQRQTVWQLGIEGSTLEDCNMHNPAAFALFNEAARAIATLHATTLSNLRPLTILNLLDRLDAVGSMLRRYRPSCRPVLDPLLARLTAQSNRIPEHPKATLHGDLHRKNLFLTGGTIALIDLDNVCEGPPAWDIGSFVAGLLAGTSTTYPPHQFMPHLQEFLDHYNRSAPWRLDAPSVAWCTAVALVVERAYRCISRLKSYEHVDMLLHLATQLSLSLSLEALTDGPSKYQARSTLRD